MPQNRLADPSTAEAKTYGEASDRKLTAREINLKLEKFKEDQEKIRIRRELAAKKAKKLEV